MRTYDTMKMKSFMILMMGLSTVAADAAIVLDSVSVSGSVLTVAIRGTLDNVGTGNDLNNRNLLYFADQRLGNGTAQDAALGYENWIGGASNGGHNVTGTLGGVSVGAIQPTSGLATTLTGSQTGIRRDGNDSVAGDVRGTGSSAGAIDYLVIGFGNGNDTYAALDTGTELDLIFSFSLGGGGIENLDSLEKFSSAFALYANDGSDNAGINANTSNYNQLTLVPEPSSTALIGLGGIALILRRRK